MNKKLSLNDQIYKIISTNDDRTAASVIRDHIAWMFDDLLNEMQSTDWRYDGTWTEAMNETYEKWINENV